MKKYILIISILLGCSTGLFAQMSQNKSTDRSVALGFKGGVNMPRMLYFRNTALMRLPQSFVFTPTEGLFLDIPLGEVMFLSPEVVYVQRGTDMNYEHATTGAQVHYAIATSNVDLRLPLEFCWEVRPYFQPYVMVGVEAGMCLFGEIRYARELNPDPLHLSLP